MSRSIRNGDIRLSPPDVDVVQTFDTNFAEANWRRRLERQGFSFHHRSKGGEPNPARGETVVELPDINGDWQRGRAIPTTQQDVVNAQSQYYLRDFEYDLVDPPLEKLYRVVDGSLELKAIPTPERFRDHALDSAANSFKVLDFDTVNNTITVAGRLWAREYEIADDGTSYASDTHPNQTVRPHFMGFHRFLRDELNGERTYWVTGEGGFKRRTYAYGWILLQTRTGPRRLRYDRVEDNLDGAGGVPPGTDPPALYGYNEAGRFHFRLPEGQQTQTRHRLRLLPGDMPGADVLTPLVGEFKLRPLRRLPWISAMFSTQNTFAQQYGVWEFSGRLADHKRQFFSWFLWGHYQRQNSDWTRADGTVYMQKFDLGSREPENGSEVVGVQAPGGSTRRFHTIHAASTSATGRYGDTGMQGRAGVEGRGPVVTSPEWDEARRQQHQVINNAADPNYVLYTGDVKLRIYWWPQVNAYNKPGNSIEWYLLCPDNVWRRIGGAISPEWTGTDAAGKAAKFAAKQTYISQGVWGNFCRGLDLDTATGSASPIDTDEIVSLVHYVRAYQFPGERAGGAGMPDRDGQYSRGQWATPGDTTRGSGIGIVPRSATGRLQTDGSVDGGVLPAQREYPGGAGDGSTTGAETVPGSRGGVCTQGTLGEVLCVTSYGPSTFSGYTEGMPTGRQIRIRYSDGREDTTSTNASGDWTKTTILDVAGLDFTVSVETRDATVGPLTAGQVPSGTAGGTGSDGSGTGGAGGGGSGDGSRLVVDRYGPEIAGRSVLVPFGSTLHVTFAPSGETEFTAVAADGTWTLTPVQDRTGETFTVSTPVRSAIAGPYNVGSSGKGVTVGTPTRPLDPTSTLFEDNVRVALDMEQLVNARAGDRFALRARVTANLKGHGIALSFDTDGSVAGLTVEGNELVFSAPISARTYRNALFVRARETGPPGTAPIVGTVAADGARLLSRRRAPINPNPTPDPDPGTASGAGTASTGSNGETLSVTAYGPRTFAGRTTGHPTPRQIVLSYSGGQQDTTSTDAGGYWSKTTLVDLAGQTVTVTLEGSDALVGPFVAGLAGGAGGGGSPGGSGGSGDAVSATGDGGEILTVTAFGPDTFIGRTQNMPVGRQIVITYQPSGEQDTTSTNEVADWIKTTRKDLSNQLSFTVTVEGVPEAPVGPLRLGTGEPVEGKVSATSATGSGGEQLIITQIGPTTFAGRTTGHPTNSTVTLDYSGGGQDTTLTDAGSNWAKTTLQSVAGQTVTLTLEGSDLVLGPLNIGTGTEPDAPPSSPPISGNPDPTPRVEVTNPGPLIRAQTVNVEAGRSAIIQLDPDDGYATSPVDEDGEVVFTGPLAARYVGRELRVYVTTAEAVVASGGKFIYRA